MNVFDVCSGIGGFSLGLEMCGTFETIAFCESDNFCRKVLTKHWPSIPIYDDIFSVNINDSYYLRRKSIDVLTAGFPCQPYSTAAAGRNPKDIVFSQVERVINEFRPKYFILENTARKAFTAGFISLCKSWGYSIHLFSVPAAKAGAFHIRNRWWLCAYPHDKSEFLRALDAEVGQLPTLSAGVWGHKNYARALRVSDGLPYRVDRLRVLGNSVCPFIVQAIGNAILKV